MLHRPIWSIHSSCWIHLSYGANYLTASVWTPPVDSMLFFSSADIQLLMDSTPASSNCRNQFSPSPVCSPTLKHRSPYNLFLILFSFSFHALSLLDSEKTVLSASMGLSPTDQGNNSQTPPSPPEAYFDEREKHQKILSTKRPKNPAVEGRWSRQGVRVVFHKPMWKGQQWGILCSDLYLVVHPS